MQKLINAKFESMLYKKQLKQKEKQKHTAITEIKKQVQQKHTLITISLYYDLRDTEQYKY